MHSFCNAIVLLAAAAGIYAETHLGGELKKTALDASGNPYIVEQDVIIPTNEIVTIKPGCVFLFKPFTGIQVHGQLQAEGSVDNPVVFTSINDKEYNPQSPQLANPFDWNGILVTAQSQKAAFKNFILRYSVYGLKAQTPNITIQNGKFRQNGQFHFTINDKIQSVQDDFYYSYGVADQTPDADGKDQRKEKPPLVKKHPKGGQESTGKLVFRWGCFGVGVAGLGTAAVAGIFAGVRYGELNDVLIKMKRAEENFDKDTYYALDNKRKELESTYNRNRIILILSSVFGGLGAVGFGVSFAF